LRTVLGLLTGSGRFYICLFIQTLKKLKLKKKKKKDGGKKKRKARKENLPLFIE